MKVGYSKILINEAIVPAKNCSSWLAATDINMMTILAGMERTSQQWIDLLKSVDLEVVKIWNSPHDGEEAIIEATLKAGWELWTPQPSQSHSTGLQKVIQKWPLFCTYIV